MRSFSLFVSIALLAGASTACGGKNVLAPDEVRERVVALSLQLEESDSQIDRNTAGIAEVGQTANAARRTADLAAASAAAANETARAASATAEALSVGRLLFEVVLTESASDFQFGLAIIPEAAKAKIDAFVEQVKTNLAGGHFEIEGHADSTGPDGFNDGLGLRRAEAVKRYLHDMHALPLHTINVISYGESQPAVPNTTREGRAQNRRVVLKVLG